MIFNEHDGILDRYNAPSGSVEDDPGGWFERGFVDLSCNFSQVDLHESEGSARFAIPIRGASSMGPGTAGSSARRFDGRSRSDG